MGRGKRWSVGSALMQAGHFILKVAWVIQSINVCGMVSLEAVQNSRQECHI